MNKTALKSFATQSRRKLIEQVQTKALLYGIDEKNSLHIEEQFGQLIINGLTYPLSMKSAFTALQKQLEQKGYKQLVEEAAYTWFNRIIAIRYMEVHEYLPERVNVLSSSIGQVDPDILFEYDTMDINIKVEEVREIVNAGNTEAAYRILFVAQCNALNRILPFMFEPIQDYTELLLPDFLLDAESVIKTLVQSEELTKSFAEIEVIGWLYQYYNIEPKDLIFHNLKNNKMKIEKFDIPAATQIFTPKWIVKYMVENSLGQIWLEANADTSLKEKMSYYIENKQQSHDVQNKLEKYKFNDIDLENLRIIDPCVGSGHMLIYAFDLLYEMYQELGYSNREIHRNILEKNMYALDIDERATQLACFALLMKAREKYKNALKNPIQFNIQPIIETNNIPLTYLLEMFCETEEEKQVFAQLHSIFQDAKIYGSILKVKEDLNIELIQARIESFSNEQQNLESIGVLDYIDYIQKLINQYKYLTHKYDCFITNPPYMGFGSMNDLLKKYVNKYYPFSKNDLFSVFIERGFEMITERGFNVLVTMQSWMTLGSYEKFRENVIFGKMIDRLLSMESMVMGIAFGTTATIFRNLQCTHYETAYQRVDYKDLADNNIPIKFPMKNYTKSLLAFESLPGKQIIYNIPDEIINVFKEFSKLEQFGQAREGMATANNDLFLKFWHEVEMNKIGLNCESREVAQISEKKWFPYNKGGEYQQWYGNNYYVVNWENDGYEIRNFKDEKGKVRSHNYNLDYLFKEGISWTALSSGKTSFRYSPQGFLFDSKGSTFFANESSQTKYILGYLTTPVATFFLSYISPTMDYKPGHIASLPYVKQDNKELLENINTLIELSKNKWDLNEISWDYKGEFLGNKNKCLADNFEIFLEKFEKVNEKMNKLQEAVNDHFISVFNLEAYRGIIYSNYETYKFNLTASEYAKQLLSFFIGCLFGRYKLDEIVFENINVIQVTEQSYFDEDIINYLRLFLSQVFSTDKLNENFQWLAEALGMKNGEDAEIRLRRYFMDEFFADHCKIYQKCPIYWLVDSGKQKGLRTLIYMHRYQPDTMAMIRFNHLQEIQAKYQQEIADLENRLVNPNLSATDKKKLNADKVSFEKKIDELREFDKRLAVIAAEEIEIDLDDGVKVNYEKFYRGGKGVLAKIK